MNEAYNFYVQDITQALERQTTAGWSNKVLARKERYTIVFVISGDAWCSMEDTTYSITEGDVFVFSGEHVRIPRANPKNPWHFISICFWLASTDGSAFSLFSAPVEQFHNIPNFTREKFKKLVSVWTIRSKTYMLVCRTLMQDILCDLIQLQAVSLHRASKLHKISAAQQYIAKNYDKQITIDELAKLCSLSPSHFRKSFKEIVGMSAIQYTIYIRINKARELLEMSSANISEIAAQTGFSDVFYFSKMFKKMTGYSPMRYAKDRRQL